MIVYFLLNLSNCYSQNENISLEFDDVRIEQVFNEIENKTAFKVFYMNAEVDMQRKISFKVVEKDLIHILNLVFADTDIVYEIVGKQILLKIDSLKNKSASALSLNENNDLEEVVIEKIQVQGTIIDKLGVPLSRVNVLEKGSSNGTSTDFEGRYNISVSGVAILEFSSVGFAAKEITVDKQTIINVSLIEETEKLSEVVVTALNTQ